MTSFDDQIRGALDDDDRAFLDSLDDKRGLFQQIGDSMHGPLSNWAKMSMVFAILIGMTLAYSFYRAVMAAELQAMVGWGMFSLGLLIMQGFLKEWMFARMNMLVVLREIKRLQVQIAQLDQP